MRDIIRIQLDANDDTILMILLHRDGTVNRMGDGTDSPNEQLILGIDEEKTMFTSLEETISPELEKFLVNQTLEAPNREGKECVLEILIEQVGKTKGVRVKYGSESMGPPGEVAKFLMKAIEVTDTWYYKHMKKTEKKKWWKW